MEGKLNTCEPAIGLLIGIPATQSEFLRRRELSNYLSMSNGWDDYRERVAEPLEQLVKSLPKDLVDVTYASTLADLKAATRKRSVVVLLAHWKGWRITNDDILVSIKDKDHAFVQRASKRAGIVAAWLTKEFARYGYRVDAQSKPRLHWRLWLDKLFGIKPPKPFDILHQVLEKPIPELDLITADVDEHIEDALTRATRLREELDCVFEDLIVPGNRLELFDDLHRMEEVALSISEDFEGVLDFTTCSSLVLADTVSRAHDYRLRAVSFDQRQEPIWAAICLEATFQFVLQGYSYLEARDHAIALMNDIPVPDNEPTHTGGDKRERQIDP